MIATGRQDARAAIVTTLLVTLAVALLPTGSYLAYLLVWLAVATVAALSGIAPAAPTSGVVSVGEEEEVVWRWRGQWTHHITASIARHNPRQVNV